MASKKSGGEQPLAEVKFMTVAEVALLLGYESDASFSRAFKRFIGVAPGAFRPQMADVSVP